MFRVACIFAFASGIASATETHHVAHKKASQTLRICNAYGKGDSLEIEVNANELGALKYKECNDYKEPLKKGDNVVFKKAGNKVGGFLVGDVPNFDAVLLLAILKQKNIVAFKSHVFTKGGNPQVALVNAYEGRAETPSIKDSKGKSESLDNDTQLTMKAGKYDIVLGSDKTGFTVESDKAYVLLRTGPGLGDMTVFGGDGWKSGASAVAPTGLVMALLAVAVSMQL
eukprot:TRINITY_DN1185_c0_g1_i1.p1 TRINITY_DN1185_c0_g1~~TRINITY_DN1185_c0_g1_i1.p1  ORF type:complete len:257 (-),score=59.91 TRINITY_DN1185_c0_g1_i1:212-892(-)